MLALEQSRRQQPFVHSYGMESTFHDPYLSQNFNTCAAFDSVPNFASLPFPFYDCSSLSAEAPLDTANTAMFASSNRAFNPSSPPPELPPPTLSNASAASLPSNTPSTVGSPYSVHAQTCSGHESWGTGSQDLGLGPRIINNEAYDQGFGAVDLDQEMTFSMHSKAADDFVGEYNKLLPSQHWPSKPARVAESLSFQSSLFPVNVEGSCRGDGAKIDSVLAKAESAIPRSLSRSAGTDSPFTACSYPPQENLQTTSQHAEATFHSPSNPSRSVSKKHSFPSHSFSSATSALVGTSLSRKPPIIMSFWDATAERPTPTYASRFQSHFFAQSGGNYVPPIESSCSFFLAADFLHVHCRLFKSMFRLYAITEKIASHSFADSLREQIRH